MPGIVLTYTLSHESWTVTSDTTEMLHSRLDHVTFFERVTVLLILLLEKQLMGELSSSQSRDRLSSVDQCHLSREHPQAGAPE